MIIEFVFNFFVVYTQLPIDRMDINCKVSCCKYYQNYVVDTKIISKII